MNVFASRLEGFLLLDYSASLSFSLLEYPKISLWDQTELFQSFFFFGGGVVFK